MDRTIDFYTPNEIGHGKGQYVLTNQSHDIEYIPR